MKKYIYFVILLGSILLWSSCRKDFDFEPANLSQLSFSVDTIFLDTIFNNTRSSTKILTVYNRSDNDININQVSLNRGTDSKYQLNVDGLPLDINDSSAESGKIFNNVEILAKDSIFVFVEATIDPTVDNLNSENDYIDQINFNTSNGNKEIQLFTQVIDANFSFSENPDKEFVTDQRDEQGEFIKIKGYNLSDEKLTLTNEKAEVIFGYAVVPSGKTLTVNAGSRLYFHRDSGLIIENDAELIINGELTPNDTENSFTNGVIIEGDKIDEDFDNLPAQWSFIWFREGSKGTIKNTIIKNATTSLLIEGVGNEMEESLVLENVQIYNSQTTGIQANSSNIKGENVVINQNGRNAINIEEGGTYNFTHSTFSNVFSFGTSSGTSISINNTKKENSSKVSTNLNASFINCIVTGSKSNEISITKSNEADLNFNFENCLIDLRTGNSMEELNPDNTTFYTNCIFNENPNFKNTSLNILQIDEESAANSKAKFLLSTDIIGTERNAPSDIGAYESIVFEKEENN